MSKPVIAIDIGNTNTHAGLIDCDTLSCGASAVLSSDAIESGLVRTLDVLASRQHGTVPVVVCSVIQSVRQSVTRLLETAGRTPVIWFDHFDGFPVSVRYESQSQLGPDRLANCLYGHAAFPGKSQIIIDAGTAITVDFLKNADEFAGGTILPGLSTQLASLHEHTSALPRVELDESAVEFPGRSTKSSMMTGVTYGTAGALTFLVSRYRELFGDALMLATGGAWKQVEALVTFEYTYVPHLTLIGTGLYWKWRKK
jgi:type III pantothenate kinase